MIIVFAGENELASRNAYLELIKTHKINGSEVYELNADPSIWIEMIFGQESLFGTKTIYTAQNLFSKKSNRELLAKLDSNNELIIWESSDLDFGIMKEISAKYTVNTFKLSTNIFVFLDSIIPGNLKLVLQQLEQLKSNNIDFVVLNLIIKRIKELILLKNNSTIAGKQAWQLSKSKLQSSKWPTDKLERFYEALIKVEVREKTSSSGLNIYEQIEIVFCYFL